MNVKVEPLTGDFLRQTYPAAVPAYHMNKTHWISLILDGSLEDSMIQDLIWRSYLLTAPPQKKHNTMNRRRHHVILYVPLPWKIRPYPEAETCPAPMTETRLSG